jgi:hypothetical protein
MKLRAATVVLAMLGALSEPVHALDVTAAPAPRQAGDYIVDQNQPLSLFLLARLSQKDVWQSFQQSSSVISGAGVFLFPGVGAAGRIRIELWDGLPRTVPGSDAGERLAFADTDGIAGQWADVFWTPLAAKAGLTYYLALAGMGQGNELGVGGAGDVYPSGSFYVDGVLFPNLDAAFRTFGPAIPEPASALLLSAGLVIVSAWALVRRRFVRG